MLTILRKVLHSSLLSTRNKLKVNPFDSSRNGFIPSTLFSQFVDTCRMVQSHGICERGILPLSLHVRNITTTSDTDKSFRKNRERIAQELLIEYDNIVFGGRLLQQQPTEQQISNQLGTPTSLNSDSTNTDTNNSIGSSNPESLSVVNIPNVTIKWSNRLRTTAGRARLQLHRINISKQKRQRSLSQKEQVLQMQQDIVQSSIDIKPVSNDLSIISKNNQCLTTGLRQVHHNNVNTILLPPQSSRRTAIVELSTKVVDDMERLETTLIHELCHVAAWIIDGNIKPPHGPYFQKWAQIATKAIPSITVTTKHNFIIHYKYTWKCINPSCTVQTIGRHSRRSIDVKRHVCGKCYGPIQAITTGNNTGISPNINSRSDHEIPSIDKDGEGTNPKMTSEQIPNRTLNEYQRFIQKHSKIIARELRDKQNKKLGNIKSSTNLLLKTNATANRRRMNNNVKSKKVSSQSILKQCAKLWQKLKKRNK